jgi:hypothetical protein
MKLKAIFFLFIVFLFGFSLLTPVHAFEMRGEDIITIPKDTVVKGSLFAGGKAITVDGTIAGDLFCGGNSITINGTITGDVICAGQNITINGLVDGNVRTVGQLIDISGIVKRNITSAGQTITLEPTSNISGEVIVAGQTIHLNSTITGDVTTYSQNVSLGEKAKLLGNLTYTSTEKLTQASGTAVVGKISHVVPKNESRKPVAHTNWFPKAKPWPQNTLGPMLFYLIIGVITVLIAPKKIIQIKKQMLMRPWIDGGVGFLVLIFSPMVIIIFALTIIGIPVAFLLGIVYAVLIIISRVWVAVVVGEKLLEAIGNKKTNLLAQMTVGVVLVEIVVKMPFVGFMIGFLVLLWGIGGFVMSFYRKQSGAR